MISTTMPMPVRAALSLLCAVALALVAVKVVLPLILLYVGGLGVEIPMPTRFVRTHPRAAIYLWALGGPAIFIALLATGIWLLRGGSRS